MKDIRYLGVFKLAIILKIIKCVRKTSFFMKFIEFLILKLFFIYKDLILRPEFNASVEDDSRITRKLFRMQNSEK